MKILIVEDEAPAAKRLIRLISEVEPDARIISHVDSVEDAVSFFEGNPEIDLAFMDIQLADGISFDIFNKVKVEVPVIFTTAFDHYAVKAFKVNSVDYLLKPVETDELKSALHKYRTRHLKTDTQKLDLKEILNAIHVKKDGYKKRFLIKTAGRLTFINTTDIGFFFSDEGNTFLVSNQNDRFLLDDTLEEIESQIDPEQFFRINRKMLLSLNAIKRIEPHFNNRFLIQTEPMFNEEVVVSRQRSADFREWLDK
ncbi:MAG: LytTR family DNA-binding domain-containing protein [Flavobacteriales bacterium]|nr:LytTR family DNA-binding domain-containing protein [Flavobacteriales bacterium]